MTTVRRLSTIFRLHTYYIQPEILRSVVFVGSCFFVCRSVSWLVRSFVNILPTAALEGRGAFSSCTYLLYKPSYSKLTLEIFVTVATGVGLRQILLLQLNCSTPKTFYWVQEWWSYLPYKPSYWQFSVEIFKFSLPWQQGLVWHKFQ